METKTRPGELAVLFLRLGLTAFGGPAAHIALMRAECVQRLQWLTEPEFLDLLGAASLIPGPSSTELAIHIGYRRCGMLGLLLGGICFLLPAALLVSALAGAYRLYGHLPAAEKILYAVKPVVVAVVAQAIAGIFRGAARTLPLAALGAVALALTLLGIAPLYVLFGAAAASGTARWFTLRRELARQNPKQRLSARPLFVLLCTIGGFVSLSALLTTAVTGPAKAVPATIPAVFLYFLKIGSVLYGSGYVLLAFLRDDLVTRWHWLSSAQLLDSVAVGQLTPGPVFTTATFIGYLLGGPMGAFVATIGIFAPSFVFVAVTAPFLTRLRSAPLTSAFLDGANVAALALMVSVTIELGRVVLVDPLTAGICGLSALLLLRFKVNSVWLIAGAAAMGAMAVLLRPSH